MSEGSAALKLVRMASWVALALVLAPAAGAQSPAPPDPAASPEATPSPSAPDLVKSRIEQEIAPLPGAFVYSPSGRRDPFVSLLRPVTETGVRATDRLEGLLIQEVSLKGIVKDRKGFTAMLMGPNNRSYFAKVGARLYDGVITAIDKATVTFRQQVTDPLSPVRNRDIRKTLYPSEEVRQ